MSESGGLARMDPRSGPLERKYRLTARFYDLLDWPWERQYRRWRPTILSDLEGHVLEAGVGTGRNLAHYPPSVHVHGVDLSEAMLRRARRRAASAPCPVTLRQADALDLHELEDAAFDWYVATFLYCVLPDTLQPTALGEMARVLAPGGRFRLVELLYSKHPARRAVQQVLAPCVEGVYGARFDRRTLEHLTEVPGVRVTGTRWLKGDTVLLIEGARVS